MSPFEASDTALTGLGYPLLDERAKLTAAVTQPVTPRAGWEVISALVTVKAYPSISRKSGESVCVAGVRLDTPRPEWVRFFPVGFRALPKHRQFEKYQVVQLLAHRGSTDRRQESFKPNLDSMVLGPVVDSQSGTWRRRWEVLGDLAGETTTCALHRAAKSAGQAAPSLGLIKPSVQDLIIEDNPAYIPGGSTQIDVDLFGTEREVLEATPFIARYKYFCAEPGCRGHEQQIVDWESGQLARRNLASHSPDEAKKLHREKFLDEMCGANKDTYFFVGNQHQHPRSFLVLGVFWPKRYTRPHPALAF
ncbi:hypothetical protein [Georgenia sp. SUBG003]|uniref:hypothetical protein n=1 Tax=Georgenia sp. SUBG003 TaxID=1497974 RepID=UPI003AB835AC